MIIFTLMEGQSIEYKLVWKEDILKNISAFANADGGSIFIGIDDAGKTVGVENARYLMENLPNIVNNKTGIIPRIEMLENCTVPVVCIKISPSSVPVSYNGRYYIRSGSVVLELKDRDLADFLMHRSGTTWDALEADTDVFFEPDIQTLDRFRKLALDRLPLVTEERDTWTLLQKLNLISNNGKIKRAAILLFDRDPQRYFPQSVIKIGLFRDEVTIMSSDLISGNLIRQAEAAFEILQTKYLLKPISYEGFFRREILEYPYEALREAIFNSIIHRDYNTTSTIQIKLFNNKISFINEGKFPPEITSENLKREHLSKPRNILLADIFYKCGFIESWGRGTLKIMKECKSFNFPEPQFLEERGVISTIIYNNAGESAGESAGENAGENLGKTMALIVNYIKENPYITIPDLAGKIDIHPRNVEKNISRLKKLEIIERVGNAKKGYWKVR